MDAVMRAYKTELDLTDKQVTACKRHAGAARYAYNWGLRRKQAAYTATGISPSAMDLHRELNALKQTELPWMFAVSKCAPQEALRNLDMAFAHFFRRCQLQQAVKLKGKLGYPQPKSRKKGLGSFRLTGSIVVFPNAIQLPRLGRLRLKECGYLPTSGTPGVKVLCATVSEQAGHWYVSVQVEHEQAVLVNTGPVVGVDLGVKVLATFSDGTVIPNPKPLKRRLKKLKRLHQAVSRKSNGSDDSPRLKPGASGMTLVCRPTPRVRLHPVERAVLTDSPIGWHLSKDVDAFTRGNDLPRNRQNIIQLGRCGRTVHSLPHPVLACGRGPFIPSPKKRAGPSGPRRGKNRKKAARKLGKEYRHIANQRANTLHQLTSSLAKTKSVIVIEDLNVAGMLKNHYLAQAIADVGFAEFRRQLTYKAAWYGSQVVVVSRWEPSSKTCSGCGWYDADLTLADRVFQCQNPDCLVVLDRDLNAAINLANLVKLAGSSPERRNACGVGSAGQSREALVKLPTQAGTRSRRKQEPNTFHPHRMKR